MASLQLRLVENDDTSCDKNAVKMIAVSLENDDVIILSSIVNIIAESRVIDSCDHKARCAVHYQSTATLVFTLRVSVSSQPAAVACVKLQVLYSLAPRMLQRFVLCVVRQSRSKVKQRVKISKENS